MTVCWTVWGNLFIDQKRDTVRAKSGADGIFLLVNMLILLMNCADSIATFCPTV